MTEPINITGCWSGTYSQHDRDHPITAIFAQVDSHLQGKMTDSATNIDKSLFEFAFEAGLPPGADEQIFIQVREKYPDAPSGPIRAATRLPEFSTLEGSVEGREVRFVKQYIGEQFAGWRIGERLFGETRASQPIQYTGTLSENGNSIDGRWSIAASAKKQTVSAGGIFHLQRQDE
jgi:hypothetical protein